jgi:hypothetical protein
MEKRAPARRRVGVRKNPSENRHRDFNEISMF